MSPAQVFFMLCSLVTFCLLCHGTVNVSDGDRRPPDKRSFAGCCVYFVILPSLSLSSISGAGERRFRSLSGGQVYTPCKVGKKGLEQAALQLFKGNTGALTRPNIYLRPQPGHAHPRVQPLYRVPVPHAGRWISRAPQFGLDRGGLSVNAAPKRII